LTYIASVNAISYTGAKPVFVDSLRKTWQMDPQDIIKKITPRTKAIMVVHLYGHPCEMRAIMDIAKAHQLFVIEDCAEAFGSQYEGGHVGSFGDIGCFSFYGNKTITTGEGGMVVTNDDTLHDRAMRFKGQGLANHREYWHDVIGYNYRMTNICAALGLAQLERADEILASKRRISGRYNRLLKDSGVETHTEAENVIHSYWMYSILAPRAEDRSSIRTALKERGIETRPLFFPVHTMPMYAGRFQRFPVAEGLSWKGINLPSYPDLTEEDISEICEVITASVPDRK
jgi:perosamine synthetase